MTIVLIQQQITLRLQFHEGIFEGMRDQMWSRTKILNMFTKLFVNLKLQTYVPVNALYLVIVACKREHTDSYIMDGSLNE